MLDGLLSYFILFAISFLVCLGLSCGIVFLNPEAAIWVATLVLPTSLVMTSQLITWFKED